MPIHVEQMNTDVSVVEGEVPLAPAQLEKLVELVMRRIEEKRRGDEQLKASVRIQRSAAPE